MSPSRDGRRGGTREIARRAGGSGIVDVAVVCAYVATAAFEQTADASLPILGAASLLMVLREQSPTRGNDLLLPVGVFLGSMLLSTVNSEDRGLSLTLSVPLLPGVLLFLLVGTRFDVRRVRMLYMTFSIVAGLTGVRLLLEAARNPTGTPSAWTDSTNSPLFVVSNDVLFFAVAAPLSLASCLNGIRTRAVWPALLSIAIGIAVTVVFRSRGAVLTTLLTVPLTLIIAGHSSRQALAALTGALLLGLTLDAVLGFPLARRSIETWSTRVPIWLTALRMYVDAPVFGNGPHVFGEIFEDYLSVPTWATFDFRHPAWAHNLYLELLAEQGSAGLGAFVLILHRFFRSIRPLVHTGDPEVRILASGATSSIVALCIGGMFEVSLVRTWVVLVLFSVLGSSAALAASARQPNPVIT